MTQPLPPEDVKATYETWQQSRQRFNYFVTGVGIALLAYSTESTLAPAIIEPSWWLHRVLGVVALVSLGCSVVAGLVLEQTNINALSWGAAQTRTVAAAQNLPWKTEIIAGKGRTFRPGADVFARRSAEQGMKFHESMEAASRWHQRRTALLAVGVLALAGTTLAGASVTPITPTEPTPSASLHQPTPASPPPTPQAATKLEPVRTPAPGTGATAPRTD